MYIVPTPKPWLSWIVLPVKNMFSWVRETTPSAAATTGVPDGAAISTPKCGALGSPFSMRRLPYTLEIMPYTGDTKKMIKCENCNSDIKYNMYKRCPLLIDDFVIKCYLC